MNHIILVNKEKGFTSNDVVRKIKKIINIKKVGHTGTLDPLAEGLLVITTGKCNKVSRFIENSKKEYIATITFGKESLTQDGEGPFGESKEIVSCLKEEIEKILNSFIGETRQTPPIYSALKVDGKRLYKYAREGKEVNIKPRKITIYELELLEYNISSLTFRCLCSKGVYIRVLGVDIAKKLNNLGYISFLKRTKVGNFTIEDAATLKEIENNRFQTKTMLEALSEYKKIVVSKSLATDVKNGKLDKIDQSGEYIIIDEDKNVIAFCKDKKIIRGLF